MNWTTDSNGDQVLRIDGRECARLPFVPDDYPCSWETQAGLKQEMERILGYVPEPLVVRQHWMMESATLAGQIGMVVCWYWSNIDFATVIRGIALIPELIRGATEIFTCAEWEIFAEALDTFDDERSPTLDKVFAMARAGAAGKLPFGPTEAFPDYPEH